MHHRRALAGWVGRALLGLLVLPSLAGAQPPEPAPAGLRLEEALLRTLTVDPNLGVLRAELASREGALLAAAGAFDTRTTARTDWRLDRTPAADSGSGEAQTLTTSIGAERILRSGQTLVPQLQLVRTGDEGRAPTTRGTLSFSLRQPLLQGRSAAVVTSQEEVARLELAATLAAQAQSVALRLRVVADQFWRLCAAQETLVLLQETEDRARVLLRTMARLIEADLAPAADLVPLEADQVAKEADRLRGEQAVFEAQRRLWLEIGEPAPPPEPFPVALGPLPSWTPETRLEAFDLASLTARAVERRGDARAARARVESAALGVLASTDALRARLDLTLTPSWQGLSAGSAVADYLGGVSRGGAGLSTFVGLSYSRPWRQEEARGDLLRAQAERTRAELELELLERRVRTEVELAVSALRRDAQELERAGVALALFERAADNEERKLRAGTSTVINVISQRDRATGARQRQIGAQLALAQSLLALRFQAGGLVLPAADGWQVDAASLTGWSEADLP